MCKEFQFDLLFFNEIFCTRLEFLIRIFFCSRVISIKATETYGRAHINLFVANHLHEDDKEANHL